MPTPNPKEGVTLQIQSSPNSPFRVDQFINKLLTLFPEGRGGGSARLGVLFIPHTPQSLLDSILECVEREIKNV